ncbi:uncharacterized protein [Leptinotarsa decemlineata]|uniref:uncharacterized protein n=1 Tax=Leptinotarsa decemlineata TaxID=7539 RepID=UPI000C25377B|nr:uncharacterized protein LOC111509645 [Leptinotarsa decemlineata]XP_023021190.1 uncharacterized protein LOC111509645 [Leptinotarsa decemlineata]
MFAVDKPKFCACLISGKCNFVRCIELILSAFCLTFAILLYSTPLHMVTKIILLAVSSAFWLITFFDVVSWWIWHRIGPKTWIMFAITAFFTYWLCGGFLLFLRGKGNNWLAIMECVLTVITGFIYLFDYIWVTMTAWDSSTKIGPTGTFIDKSVSSCFLFEVNEYECPILKTRARRYPTTVKALKNPSMSHGGTFHVSKEFAPLSSASKDPCHCPKKSSRSTSTSPGRRKNEEHSHNCHRSRSPESEEKSTKNCKKNAMN